MLDRFVFDTEVAEARWDDDAARWQIRTTRQGVSSDYTADVLVSAAGALSDPKLPDIDGIDSFQGEIFHSAQWDHDYDLTGKRVAVIGTGASAIQIVPEVAKQVAHLDVYQRTAPYVIPRMDRAYTGLERLAFKHVPGFQRMYRTGIYFSREMLVPSFVVDPRLALPAKRAALANLNKGIKDPELREKVTPTFEIGCKRILISNDWYPALAQDNVDLVTDGITKVTPTAVVTKDGTEREIDVLIVATGFHTTDLPIASRIHGRNGETPRRPLQAGRHAGLQGRDRARLPEPVLHRRAQHRPRPLEHGLHDRVAGRLRRRRRLHDAAAGRRGGRADRAGAARLERRRAGAHEAHGVEHRRLLELVPRRARPQRHAVATHDVQVPSADRSVRHRELPRPPGGFVVHPRPGEGVRMKTLDGKVVVITGAGSGIGRELALRAADQGAILALSDWDEVGLVETARLVQTRASALGGEVRTDKLDVRDRQAMHEYAATLRRELGRVNVIVNNAGVALHGDFEEVSYEDFEWIMDVDFWGVVHGTKEFLPHLIESGDGHVVNISSLFGLISMPGQTAYNAAKYGVRGFTEALRQELHPRQATRCNVTCVHPGGIKTAIARNARATESHDQADVAKHFDGKLARMTPERAAEIIWDAVLADKPRVVVGADAKVLDWFARIVGARYQRAFAFAARRLAPRPAARR